MTPEELKNIRKRLGVSQAVLGDEIGRTSRMIKHYESGKLLIPKSVKYALLWLSLPKNVRARYKRRFLP